MSTILLLDDDKDFRQAIVPAIEAKGHTVVQAHRGADASAALRKRAFDLMIVDGLLPDVDGPSWIARERARGNTAPVVFVSAFWRDLGSFNRLTRDLRVALIAHKPVSPPVFAEQIEQQLQAGSAATATPATAATAAAHAGSPAGAPVAAPEEPSPQEMFRSLQAEYARELPAKLRELARAVQQARAQAASPVAIGEARGRAHRLRGTAGTYGFRAVGEAAGRVEDGLARLRPTPVDGDWAEIEAAVSVAVEAADAAALAAGDASAGPSRCLGGRLLVVSADAAFLSFAEARGRQQLLEVDACATPTQGLGSARIRNPDAAIVDCPAEVAAGFARDLRGIPGCEAVGIGFVGEGASPADRVAAVHAGASLYLIRPLTAEAFDAAARQLVGVRQAGEPRVLVLDDDAAFAQRVAAILRRRGMVAGVATDPFEVLEALEQWQPDLLLLDLMMPGIGGLDVCRMLRATPRWQELPVVIVSAQTAPEARLAAYQSGADDCLPKPVVEEELIARVRVRVERARLLRERFDKDPVTGLMLRRPFIEATRARLLEAARHGRAVAVALLAVDDVRSIVDARGPLAADAVVAGLGALMARRFRAEDLRGRWADEAFVLAFPGETPARIEGAIGRLLAEFREIEFRAEEQSEPFRATFTAGIAGFPEDGASLEALLRCAERRLRKQLRVKS